jgi:hypothetical protein
MSTEIDPALHKKQLGTVEKYDIGPIKRLDAKRYARAVEDNNPLFHSIDYAQEQGYEDVVVPPNYVPAIIETGEGAPSDALRQDGIDPELFPVSIPDTAGLMGGGQELTIDRYIVAGEYITAEKEFSDIYQRESRDMGILTFIEMGTDFFVLTDNERERVIQREETFILGDRP